jgi:hypothetical protein
MAARQPALLRERNARTGRLENNAIATELRRGVRAELDRTLNVGDAKAFRERVAKARTKTLEGAAAFREAIQLLPLSGTDDDSPTNLKLALSEFEERLLWWCHWYSLPVESHRPRMHAAERAVARLMEEQGASRNAACNAVAAYLLAEGLYTSAFVVPSEARSHLAASLRKQSEKRTPKPRQGKK